MDQDLARLERRVAANPADEEAGDAYEAALRRSGVPGGPALRQLYTFRFECSRRWEQLEPTADPLVRRCEGCARDVHYARDPAEAVAHSDAGRCVAVLDLRRDESLDALAARPRPLPLAGARGEHPCLLAPSWEELLVDFVTRLPGERARARLGQGPILPPTPEVEELLAAAGRDGCQTPYEAYSRSHAAQQAAQEAARRAAAPSLWARVLGWVGAR
ncbi:MAG: hypothetical protein AB7N76_32895 [Planctomycetota bacterium]